MSERNLDHEALHAVAKVQDSGEYGALAPNWTLPADIPTQRLSGLKRRGYLDCAHGMWWLTRNGCWYLDAMRSELVDAS